MLRQPSSSSDIDQTWEILRRSFNSPPSEKQDWLDRMSPERFWGLYDGDVLLATAQVWEWEQTWGGRPVRSAGVSSVGVDPSQRGRGLATRLMAGLFAGWRDGGLVTSSLMPASTALYRGVGYEAAALWSERRVPMRSLLSLPRSDLRPRVATADDVPALAAVVRRVAARHDGWVTLSDAFWERMRKDWDDGFAYVVDGRGFVLYRQADDPMWGYRTTVQAVVADDHEAALALWHAVGSSSTMSREAVVNGAALASLVLLLPEQDLEPHRDLQLLLRLVDLPGAMAARGWPVGLDAQVDLDVDDPHVADNGGRWRLTVSGGEASMERGGDGTVAVGVGALASLYAGWASSSTLAATGRLAAPVPELDAAFGRPGTPTTQVFF